jgi:hypothetical protein
MLSVFKLIVGAPHLVTNFGARDIKNPIFVFLSVDRRLSFPTVIDKCLFEGAFKFNTLTRHKVILIRLDVYLIVNRASGGGSPKFFIHTLLCQNYMRLKFDSYEFDK